MMECSHQLVIPVHKVHLETFHTHLREILADILHIIGKGIVTCPENDTYALSFSIGHKFIQVDFRDNLHKVSLFVHCPSLVQDYILHSVLGCEIYIVFVCSIVNTSLEIHAFHSPAVPPFPSYLSWLHPAEIPFRSL